MTPEIHITSSYSKKYPSHKIAYIYFYIEGKGLAGNANKILITQIEKKRTAGEADTTKSEVHHLELETSTGFDQVFVISLEQKQLQEELIRNSVADVARSARGMKCEHIVIDVYGLEQYVDEVAEGLVLGSYVFSQFKSAKAVKQITAIQSFTFVTSHKESQVKNAAMKGIIAGESVCLARDFVNTPASHMHPETLMEAAFAIEKKSEGAVTVEVLDERECKRLGMGAFLGVAQGSTRKPAFIVLKYKGTGKKTFAFVGKSITFDSGGLSLKPADAMMDMKMDMSGGAAVLGVFEYLARVKPTVAFSHVYGILPACENMPSGNAIKPGDIVTAINGKTIEVLNTDAEGRLTLADALVYAEKKLKADYIVDMATLTGACMVALGTDLAGLFANDRKFAEQFKKVAHEAGDEHWELPLYSGYVKQMKSDIADLKNIGGGRYGGAITAAVFLQEFIEKSKWIHIDIAGPAHRDGSPKGAAPKGGTGWGVLSIIRFLECFSHYEDIKASSN